MRPAPALTSVLPPVEWQDRSTRHEMRVDQWVTPHLERRRRGEPHPVLDFLFTYYRESPGRLRRWHPGAGTALAPREGGPAPHGGWRWYRTDVRGVAGLDHAAFLADRAGTVRFIRELLSATSSRPAFTGCFGLHEWAMVYRADERRHPLPLRLGRTGTDAVVEGAQIRCSHYDAFRFFTPEALGRNRLQPSRETQVALEQPGCLHATMDLYKWAYKLGPAVPGELLADCLALAADVRELDMRASPYDLRAHGYRPVAIETAEGKAEYVAAQRAFADRGVALRRRLLEACEAVLGPGPAPTPRQ
ncbi:3-methyladenine DNA glycosylase [Blastococcus saxobsidens]|uniref:3-methyladenine DNA glycosylase n=1 Tax=Blastococcus saxobsidens TaxID=138336 RepID=A0A4Q7YBN9_9ACTN|nr:3-methyladenine DNA glycosylase [Blastococcus saxobsidens]RZU33555.1 hypothetical protein BKA19_3287 [Blastococcus saxobsidens]